MTVVVRPATLDDLDGLVASIHELVVEDAGGHDPSSNRRWALDHGAQTLRERLHQPDRRVLVVDQDGVVVGHLAGRVEDPVGLRTIRTATISSLYVVPAFRGHGWGSRLVEAFLTWADEVGAGHTTVTAYADNSPALGFYRSHGFIPLEVTLRRSPHPR